MNDLITTRKDLMKAYDTVCTIEKKYADAGKPMSCDTAVMIITVKQAMYNAILLLREIDDAVGMSHREILNEIENTKEGENE